MSRVQGTPISAGSSTQGPMGCAIAGVALLIAEVRSQKSNSCAYKGCETFVMS
ncbi:MULTISPECIES: hypothetical protein [Moorena]|uniref:hypothetical protein n=1 Tax=Moorena TaxID=1155738 RepID=UPI0012B63144|nr:MULTISPECIES: hypothetical protein [Moorena]NEP35195.1 hypothetical protein [Moorena sp. SIO3B2]NEP68621.1 hypothetical protein [Moorena sp. SIO3A5]NES46518.1 hypothetical protein [Moorena sp. SIO2C4]